MVSELQNYFFIGNLVARDMWLIYIDALFVYIWSLHIVVLEKLWFMLVGFSCDDTCLSWIELILDLGMWASLNIYLWSHSIYYGGYDVGHIVIDMVWFLYKGFSFDDHSSHGIGSILLSWKFMKFVHVLVFIFWHTWWWYWHRCWCTIYDDHVIDLGDLFV